MNYVVFDLEWNRYARAVCGACPDEIIQIGAVRYSGRMEYEGSFNCLIKPRLYHKMEPTVGRMTGLSIGKLEKEGVSFPEAFREFRKFMGEKSVLMSWGMQDASVLRSNCLYYGKGDELGFLARFADLQRYAADRIRPDGGQRQINLKDTADLFPIEYEEESLHDALVDATISGEILERVYDKKRFSRYVVDARELNQNYKSVHITDLEHECVDKRELRVRCPCCGKYARQRQTWVKRRNKFVSEYYCKKCAREFSCTMEILLTYANAVKYKKKIRFPEEAETKKPVI